MTENNTYQDQFEAGKALFEAGDPQGAARIFVPLLEQDPEDLTLRQYLTQAYCAFGYFAEAVVTFRPNFVKMPEGVEKYGYFGNLCHLSGQAEEALLHLGKAHEIAPNNAEILSVIALTLVQLGDLQEANIKIREALRIAPDHIRSLVILADIDPGALSPDNFSHLANVVADEKQHPGNRIDVAFALGKAYLKTKVYDQAFKFYQAGNTFLAALFQEQGVGYDQGTEETNFQEIKSFYTKELLEKISLGLPGPVTPVFIIGLPRSGTTLVEQIISSHSAVLGAGEEKMLGQFFLHLNGASAENPETPKETLLAGMEEALRGEYFQNIIPSQSEGITHTTDKMPLNFQFVGLAAKIFPTAKFIFIRRDPLDNCLSMFFQPLNNSYPAATSLDALGDFYKRFEQYLKYWAEALPEGRVLEVSYEDLVGDQEGISKKMISFAGLKWEDACLDFHKNPRSVQTMSNMQVRQPITAENIGRWKHFEGHIGSLKAALGGAGSDE